VAPAGRESVGRQLPRWWPGGCGLRRAGPGAVDLAAAVA